MKKKFITLLKCLGIVVGADYIYFFFRIIGKYTPDQVMIGMMVIFIGLLFEYVKERLVTPEKNSFKLDYLYYFMFGLVIAYNRDIMGGEAPAFLINPWR